MASNGAKQRTDTHKPTDTQTDKSTVGVKRGSKESSVNCVTIFERQCAHSVICIKSIDDDYYPVHTHTHTASAEVRSDARPANLIRIRAH